MRRPLGLPPATTTAIITAWHSLCCPIQEVGGDMLLYCISRSNCEVDDGTVPRVALRGTDTASVSPLRRLAAVYIFSVLSRWTPFRVVAPTTLATVTIQSLSATTLITDSFLSKRYKCGTVLSCHKGHSRSLFCLMRPMRRYRMQPP